MLVQTSSIRFADRTVVLQHASCADLIHAVHNAFAPEIAATGADAAAFVLVQRIAERGELQVDSEETLREARLATEEPPLLLRLERAQGSAQRVRRVCGQCGAVFSSRNRLFRHIEDFGHEGDDPSGGASSSGRSYVLPAHAGFNAYYSAVSPVAPSAAAWAEVFAAFQRPVASIVRFHADSALAPLASRLLEAWTSPAECGVLRDAAIGIGDAVLAPGYPRGLVGAAQECGALSRQELNSMLPPLLLGVNATHAVLDLCCAPGSKTLELMDLMAADAGTSGDVSHRSDANASGGLLVANDANRGRLVTTAQRARRHAARRRSLVLTTSDARHFATTRTFKKGMMGSRKLRFDRVLCDVPCSGDGTLRRSPGGWAKWSVREGLSLHVKQLAILKRGVEVLRPGGRLLYSTCSLNPVENEAVVAAAIRFFAHRPSGPSITLRVVPLPDAAGAHGVSSWRVPHPEFWERWSALEKAAEAEAEAEEGVTATFSLAERVAQRVAACSFDEFCDVPEELLVKKKGGVRIPLRPSMFPRGDVGLHGEEGAEEECDAAEVDDVLAQMAGCARALPLGDDNQRGGFFCALLERSAEVAKVKATVPLKAAKKKTPAAVDGGASSRDAIIPSVPPPLAEGERRFRHQPSRFVFRPAVAETIEAMSSFWGLASPRFPLRLVRRSARGDLVLVSPFAAQLAQKTTTLMPVVEGGQYLFTSAMVESREWTPIQEAASTLAQCAQRRVLRCDSAGVFAQLLEAGRATRAELEALSGVRGLHDCLDESGGVVVSFAPEGEEEEVMGEGLARPPVAVAGTIGVDGSLTITASVRLRNAIARLLRAGCAGSRELVDI